MCISIYINQMLLFAQIKLYNTDNHLITLPISSMKSHKYFKKHYFTERTLITWWREIIHAFNTILCLFKLEQSSSVLPLPIVNDL